jgi:hypothetical protein
MGHPATSFRWFPSGSILIAGSAYRKTGRRLPPNQANGLDRSAVTESPRDVQPSATSAPTSILLATRANRSKRHPRKRPRSSSVSRSSCSRLASPSAVSGQGRYGPFPPRGPYSAKLQIHRWNRPSGESEFVSPNRLGRHGDRCGIEFCGNRLHGANSLQRSSMFPLVFPSSGCLEDLAEVC